jgi:5'-3' exonuclease
MPAAIDTQVKKQVVKQYLSGDSRDRIAADNGIGAGTVSNIVNEWKQGVEDSDYNSLRELAIYSKKEGFGLSHIAASTRLGNYIQKLGANQDQIESFIANLAHSPEPEKLIDVANQVAHLSKAESIPLGELEGHIKQKEEEKQMLEDEIKQRRAILESTNVEIQIINEYKQLKAELNKYHLSSEDPKRLLTVLTNLKGYRYDAKKIVAELSNIKSLKRRENALQYKCKLHEERMARCREVLPLCEQIVRFRIGIYELLAFHTAVCEKAERYNLSKESAAYRVIEEIRDYNNLGGMKKQQSDVAMQIYAMNQLSARQNNAIMALMRLQIYGITDHEILNVYEFLNSAHFESAATIRR